MKPVVIAMPGNERLSRELAAQLDLDQSAVTVRHTMIETAGQLRRAVALRSKRHALRGEMGNEVTP